MGSELPPYQDAFSAVMQATDGRNIERLAALRQVINHLRTVAAGIGHPNVNTRMFAASILQDADPLLVEMEERVRPSPQQDGRSSSSNPANSSYREEVATSTDGAVRGADKGDNDDTDTSAEASDSFSWDDIDFDAMGEWYSEQAEQNEHDFAQLSVSHLCSFLGLAPSFGIDRSMDFLFGDDAGLHIGDEGMVDLFLTDSDGKWVLTLKKFDHVPIDDDPVMVEAICIDERQWEVCSMRLPAGEVAYHVARVLREHAELDDVQEKSQTLNALMYWGALVGSHDDAIWAIQQFWDQDPDVDVEDRLMIGMVPQVTRIILNARLLHPEIRSQLVDRYDSGQDLWSNYHSLPKPEF
jgi:hypothetical protein